jgi:uncharacterized protein (TIGR02611 family)
MAEVGEQRSGESEPAGERELTLIERIRERRAQHKERSRIVRGLYLVAGFTVLLAGIVMTGPVPGPGIVVIPIGLGMLALEFVWAERLLEKAIDHADAAKRRASETTTTQKILSGLAIAFGIAAFVTAAAMWDIPLLPV